MEYGLWNFHGGFWTGGNGSSFSSTDVISRNFYTTVNNEMEPPTFHVTTPGNGGSGNSFTNVSPIQSCPTSLRTNLEFLTVKNAVPVNARVPSMIMPVQQDELLQSVALEGVPMASDFITEQSSMDSLAPADSSMPSLLSHQQSHSNNSSNNHNNNNNITSTTTTTTNNNNNNNNNINDDDNNDDEDDEDDEDGDENEDEEDEDDNCSQMGKKDKMKIGGKDNKEIWEDINGQGTNIKPENNSAIDYLFQQSYQHPMYGMVFSKISSKREAGTSDETEEEDDEIEEGVPRVRIKDNVNSSSPSIQNRSIDAHTKPRSPGLQSIQDATSGNLSKNGYECGECGLVAETRPGLKKHISVFHPNPGDLRLNNALLKKMSASSKCPMSSCRFRSSERNEMEVHMARHVTGEYKINGKKKAGPLTPQRVRYEREEYRCQICAYSCTVEKAFYKHLKIHSVGRQMSNQVKISCVICGKDRSTEVDMNKHMKKHRDDRYFCCDICIFKTVQLKKLIQHRRMHTGEKPHLCPHCSYRSARRDNLRSHVRRVHKKDNLFCDTFSPRGLVLSEGGTNNSTVSTTPIPAVDSVQQTPMK